MTWTEADETGERIRVADAMCAPNAVFVFGSNEAGIHGAGAAAFAQRHYGARWGVGQGLVGRSYAWPTKSQDTETLPLGTIAFYGEVLCADAAARPQLQFIVTRVGCGLAGLTDEQMAGALPESLPPNLWLPPRWIRIRREVQQAVARGVQE